MRGREEVAPLEVRNESETKERQFWQLENRARLVMIRAHIFLYILYVCACTRVVPSKLDSDSILAAQK